MTRSMVLVVLALLVVGLLVGCSQRTGGGSRVGSAAMRSAGVGEDEIGMDEGDGGAKGTTASKSTTAAAPRAAGSAGTTRSTGKGAARAGGARAGGGWSISGLGGAPGGVGAAAPRGAAATGGIASIARDAQGYPKSWTGGSEEVRAVKQRIYGPGLPRGEEVAQGPTASEIVAEKIRAERTQMVTTEKRIIPGGAGLYALAWAGVTGQTGLMTRWYADTKYDWGVLRREADSIVSHYGVDWREIKPAPGAPAGGLLALAELAGRRAAPAARAAPIGAARAPMARVAAGPVGPAPGLGRAAGAAGGGIRGQKRGKEE